MIPMEQLETAFEKTYPDIDVVYEGHGSIQVVRHTTEIKDPVSLAFVADYSLLPLLMYPASRMGDRMPRAALLGSGALLYGVAKLASKRKERHLRPQPAGSALARPAAI